MLLHSFAKMYQLTNDMNYVSLKSVITSYATWHRARLRTALPEAALTARP